MVPILPVAVAWALVIICDVPSVMFNTRQSPVAPTVIGRSKVTLNELVVVGTLAVPSAGDNAVIMGLSLFKGIKVTVYSTDQGLTNNYILSIAEDNSGSLWLATYGGGVCRFNNGSFNQYTEKEGIGSNTVRSIVKDKTGNLCISTFGDGIIYYNGNSFSHYTEQEGLPSNRYKTSIVDSNYVWFASEQDGAVRFDGKTFEAFSKDIGLNSDYILSMCKAKDGKIWFGTDEGLYCYDGKVFTRFLDNPNIINRGAYSLKNLQCMYEDNIGNMWFGSGFPAFEGIFRFDGKTIENFRPNNEDWIRMITEDKSGTLLFVTRHNGVQAYNGKTFTSYSQPLKLRNDLLNCIFVDKQKNIWYGSDYINDNDFTKGGVWKYDGKSFVEFTMYDGLTNTSPFLIMEDRAGNIWFGTRNTGLFKYDGKTFTNYSE